MSWPHPQVLFNGLLLGSLYGCAAMGFQLISGTTTRVHLAFGHVAIVAGLAGAALTSRTALPLAMVAMVLGLVSGAAGFLLHHRALWRSNNSGPRQARAFLLLGLGSALVLEDLGRRIWPLPVTSLGLSGRVLHMGGLTVTSSRLAALIASLGLALGLTLFLHRTRWGRALRAWQGEVGPVSLMGVNPVFLGKSAMGLGFAIAGLAGGMLAATQVVSIQDGMSLTIRCFCLATLGGVLSPGRVLVVGWLLGAWEAWVGQIWGAQWSSALGFTILLMTLLFGARKGNA